MRPPEKPYEPRRRAGRIRPRAPIIFTRGNACWLCGRRGAGTNFGGRWWCWRHHPLRPSFGRQPKGRTAVVYSQVPAGYHPTRAGYLSGLGRSATGTSDRDIERHQRKVDAVLGRKKRKPAKPRKRPRDRAYRR